MPTRKIPNEMSESSEIMLTDIELANLLDDKLANLLD
jgi:hypothetical protein